MSKDGLDGSLPVGHPPRSHQKRQQHRPAETAVVWTTGADVRVGARRRLRSGSLPSDRWTHCPFRDPRLQLEATSRPDDPPWSRLVALVDRAIDPLSESAWRMLLEFWHASVQDPQLRRPG